MNWTVLTAPEYAEWFASQGFQIRSKIAEKVGFLEEFGPALGRPGVDTVYNSEFDNMKELRIKISKRPFRILFAFDPLRRAILLLGGDKGSDKRWYDVNIRIADERYRRHLNSLTDRPSAKE